LKNRTIEERISQEPADILGADAGAPEQLEIHPEVKKTLELFTEYENARNDWATKFQESVQFRQGAQWSKEQTEILERRGQAAIVVNRIHPIVETAKALLTYNRPQFRSTGREDSDTRTSKIYSDVMAWIWERSNGNTELKQAIDDYYVGGMGILQVFQDAHVDMGRGEVLMKSLNPLDVYIDPNSRDTYGRDAANIIILKVLTDEQAKKLFPEYENIWGNAESVMEADHYPGTNLAANEKQSFLGNTNSDHYHVKRKYYERYERIKVDFHHIFEPDTMREDLFSDDEFEEYMQETTMCVQYKDGTKNYVNDPEQVAQYMTYIEKSGSVYHMEQPEPQMNPETGEVQEMPPEMVPGEEDENSIPDSTIYLIPHTKAQFVELGYNLYNQIQQDRIKMIVSVGDKLLYTRVLPCEDYPIVLMQNIHNRNPYPESDVRLYRPLQEYVNKIRSLIIAHASTSTNVKLLIPRGSVDKKQIEEEWGRAGTSVIEFDAELGAPVVAGPVPLPNELYKNEADAKSDLEYGFGIYEMMQGAGQGAPSTYRGTVIIDEFGQRRIKSRRDDIEAALNQLCKVSVPLMQQMYTEEKIIRLVQPNNAMKEVTLNQSIYDEYTGNEIERVHDMTAGKYDIVVVAGSTLPANRWALLETYQELYKNGLIDQIEVLKKTDLVDIEGVINRSGEMAQLQNALQDAEEQIKTLQGDLQTANREDLHSKKRLEVEKFKGKMGRVSDRAEQAGELFKARIGDAQREMNNEVKSVKSEKEDGRS
jgi:hypothetical protein